MLSIRVNPMNSTVLALAAAFCLAAAASQPAAAEICTRLPLSDVAVGKEASANAARG